MIKVSFLHFFRPVNALVALLAIFAICACEKTVVNIKQEIADCNCELEMYQPNSKGIAATGYFDGREVSYTKVDGLNVWEGDILLTDEQLKAGAADRGTISTIASHIWPAKTLVWKYKNGLNAATKTKWQTAIAHWASVTNVLFKERTNEADYVEVISGQGCYSYIGKIGGKQPLSIGSGCSSGNAIHEVGHALGLYHEHTRTDRNSYVIVNFANIASGAENNFVVCSSCTANGSLDFGSIMMYDSYAFSKNGLPTITTTSGGTFTVQRTALSNNDKSIIATKY